MAIKDLSKTGETAHLFFEIFLETLVMNHACSHIYRKNIDLSPELTHLPEKTHSENIKFRTQLHIGLEFWQ